MTHAAIAADFVTWKHVPSRKVYQLVLEIPQERAPQVADALGWPDPATGCPVAVARLRDPEPVVGRAAASDGDERKVGDCADGKLGRQGAMGSAPTASEPAAGGSPAPRRRWEELSPAQQAGIRCQEQEFSDYLYETNAIVPWLAGPEGCAEMVRRYCRVSSRAEINTNPRANARWRALDAAYQAATGRVAEQRA